MMRAVKGHCEDCKWWREDLPGMRDASFRLCGHSHETAEELPPVFAVWSWEVRGTVVMYRIETAPEFGCVEWMPKRELSNA